MAMRDVKEPSKWVCRLTTIFEDSTDDDGSSGSGFLVNIPHSAYFCIFTAGHNIVAVAEGKKSLDNKDDKKKEVKWAKTIKVSFPGGLEFWVTRNECHVSEVYAESPTSEASDDSSVLDYGLITTAKKKHIDTNSKFKDLGGCGFDILVRDFDILHNNVAVHGYPKDSKHQEMNSSGIDHIDRQTIQYSIDTMGGVSGGPVIISKNGLHTAIGIHNYAYRATRLTPAIMFEILSWINDYRIQQVFRMNHKKQPAKYLQATHGTAPNIVLRPGVAYLNCVLAAAPQTGSNHHCLHVILSSSATPGRHRTPLLLLTLKDENDPPCLTFCEERPGARGQIRIDILGDDPDDPKSFSFCWQGNKEQDRKFLQVKPRKRGKHCDFGCITQDDDISVAKRAAALSMYPYEPLSEDKDRNPTSSDLPPLYRAVLDHNQKEVLKLLSEGEGAAVACTCGTTALSKAAENGDWETVKTLMNHGASMETMNKDKESAEMLAKRNGHEKLCKRLETLRCSLVEDLLSAAKQGSIEQIRSLLSRGVDPNARNTSKSFASAFLGSSALELAAQFGHSDVVLLLVRDAKASVTDKHARGWTALHKAAQKGDATAIKYLLEYGANVNVGDRDGMTPLHRAAELGHAEAVSALCADKKINIDPRGRKDATPLMLAAGKGHIETVKILIQNGANTALEDRNELTARDRAEVGDWEDVCKLLP